MFEKLKARKIARKLEAKMNNLYKQVEPDVMKELEQYNKDNGMPDTYIGQTHIKNEIAKRLIKEKFNEEWLSPSDLHPDKLYD